MRLWMSWTLDDVGSAGQMVDDVATAARALDESVERSRRAFRGDDLAWGELKNAADHVAARVLSDGREALEQGQPWSLAVGGVYIQLLPRDAGSPRPADNS